MISHSAQVLKEQYQSIYESFSRLKEVSPLTVEHCVKTANIAYVIGKELKLKPSKLEELVMAALIHDIGKVSIQGDVLVCNRNLTSEEFEEMKQHVQYGMEITKRMPQRIRRAIAEHHENIDGSGYPKGLTDSSLSLYGKILRVADVADAICSPREYKKALEPQEACTYLLQERNILFDVKAVEAYLTSVGFKEEIA